MNDNDTEALRTRIEQLEAALAAAGAGELDAVVLGDGHTITYAGGSAERPYRLMVEQMAEGALTLDDETGRILYSNAAFAVLLGRPLEHLVGRPLFDFVDAGQVAIAKEIVQGIRPMRCDLVLKRADGDALPVAVSAVSVESEDGRVRCLVISDLRERRRTERLRRAEQELRHEVRRTEEFIAMLGHELRNPLAPIRHAAELLTESGLRPEQLEALQSTIVRQTTHLKRLVDDLLDIARVTRGSLRIDRRDIDLHEAIDAAVEASQDLFAPRGRTLEVVTPDHPVIVFGDSVRLTQVVTNLLSNAAKFTEHGGRVALVVTPDDEDVQIVVEDNGRGIPPEALPNIFDPFVRGDAGGNGSGGLGLGLALVKRVVALHDGIATVASDGVGQGSRFAIQIPRASPSSSDMAAPTRAPPPGDEEADRPRPSGPGRGDTQRLQVAQVVEPEPVQPGAKRTASDPPSRHRVLVCDDNSDAAEMAALLLQTRGHEVSVQATGSAALAAARTFRPTVVLLDIGLPDMSGYDVARRLRTLPEMEQTVIVAVTGYGQQSDKQAAMDAGCDLHLVKPVTGERLFEALAARRVQPR